jgi:type II secretory pathway component PulF
MAISLTKKSGAVAVKPQAKGKAAPSRSADRFLARVTRRVKPQEILFFLSQISLMLDVGTPLTNAVRALKDQTKNPNFKKILETMLSDINAGKQLSHAMGQHPGVFNKLAVSMIHAGETGGFLKMIVDHLVLMQERRQALMTQIRSALTYPAVLCVVAFGVMIFVLVGILPKFMVFFEGKEKLLPLSTRFFMLMSDSLRHAWYAYVLMAVGLGVGIYLIKASSLGGRLLDRTLVGAPVIGRLATKIYTCQLLRTLGYLLDSKVLLLQALEVTRTTFSNSYYRNFIDRIAKHVQQGGRLSQPFVSFPYILESAKEMVATGEDAGELPRVMIRLAEFYDAEVERDLKTLASLLEPLALIVIGIVIGAIVSSIVLPMFRLASAVH